MNYVMANALDVGKSSATGSFHLLIGVVISSVVMSVGTIILGWLLPRGDVGLYGVVLIPYSMTSFFRDWGVNSAMTKQIASLKATNRESEIRDVIIAGIVFEIIMGALLSMICFGTSTLLAAYLVPDNPDASTLIAITSLSILAGALFAAASAIFVGFERMKLNSLTAILQAVVKTAMGPLLIILGFSVLGAVVAATVSIAAGGIIGIIIVYFALFRPIQKQKDRKNNILRTLKPMLSYGIPLTIANLTIGLMPAAFAFVMAPIAGTELMGDYSTAIYFAVLITFFTSPISTALFPTFVKVHEKAEPELMKTVFASSVKYASVLILPATVAIMALSGPMVSTLFGSKFPNAPLFLTIHVASILLTCIGSISLGTFLTGLGKTKQVMRLSLLSTACILPLLLYMALFPTTLTPIWGATLGVIGIVLANIPGTIWGLYWVWKNYGVKADFSSSAKILVASGLAGIVTYSALAFALPWMTGYLPFLGAILSRAWAMLIVGAAIFLLVYFATAPLIGAINQMDLTNLRAMFSAFPRIIKFTLNFPLCIIEKILAVRNRRIKNSEKSPNL
jgi:O-antigen/teichoic acid export membrane protein